jgi:hypothetical protein
MKENFTIYKFLHSLLKWCLNHVNGVKNEYSASRNTRHGSLRVSRD